MRNKRRGERGVGLVEYALIAVLVALSAVVVMTSVGVKTNAIYCQVNTGLNGGPSSQTGNPGGTNGWYPGYVVGDASYPGKGWWAATAVVSQSSTGTSNGCGGYVFSVGSTAYAQMQNWNTPNGVVYCATITNPDGSSSTQQQDPFVNWMPFTLLQKGSYSMALGYEWGSSCSPVTTGFGVYTFSAA